MLKKCFCYLLLFIPLFVLAAEHDPIPVNKAFEFSMKPSKTDSIIATWKIADGYFLYKNQFKFKVLQPDSAAIGLIIKPTGIEKTDEILGKHFVYDKQLEIPIPILNPSEKPLKLLVEYQGCAAWGFCYPPQTKLVTIKSKHFLTANDITIKDYEKPTVKNATIASNTAQSEQSAQSKVNQLLQNGSLLTTLLLFFGFGLLLAFTPCVLPMIPILSGLIVGHGKQLSTKKALSLSLAYVLGMAISFAIVGIIVGLLGSSVQAAMQKPWVLILFSSFFVALALSLFGLYELQLPQSLQQKINNLSRKQKTGNYLGVFIMGVLSTLIVSPCVSAPLVGALAYIGNTGNALLGGVALFIMALGMGVPLLVIGTSFGKLLPRAGHWMHTVKSIFGVIMLGVAIWMLERILSGPATLFLWASLAIVSSIFMGAVTKTAETAWGKLWKGFGIILLTYGVLLVIGAAMGNSDVFNPLQLSSGKSGNTFFQAQAATQQPHQFIRVKSLADVEAKINQAKNSNTPVMLDFYADWCVACKEMEKYTFSNAVVQTKLKPFTLLQADVTANDATDKALMRHFGVIAPPTILFFNAEGKLLKNATIVGEMNAEKFSKHLNSLPLN